VIPLQAVAIALVAVGGLAVVLARDVVRQALLNGFFGLGLVILFLVFQAPDVALSALAVGGAAAPLVLALAIAKVQTREQDGDE
jgi:energy-converting hydrogenase B subunit D